MLCDWKRLKGRSGSSVKYVVKGRGGDPAHVGLHGTQRVPNYSLLCCGIAAHCEILLIPSPSDIYAIGVGSLDVDWKELNNLGSKKDGERHAFILKDVQALSQVFEHMLGECASPSLEGVASVEPAEGPGMAPTHSAPHRPPSPSAPRTHRCLPAHRPHLWGGEHVCQRLRPGEDTLACYL